MPGMAKVATRPCPICKQVKTYPATHRYCSKACANEAQRSGRSGTTSEHVETQEQTEDTWNIHLPSTRIHTLDELIAHFAVDLSVWEVDRFVANKWEMGYKDASAQAQVEQLFQVKAWLRKKKHVSDAKQEIADLRASAAAELCMRPLPPRRPVKRSGLMLEVAIPDLHILKLAWGKETRHGNYDSSIAVETHDRALDALLERTASLRPERIVLPLGNDLLNVDGGKNSTANGTPQDTDTRYNRGFKMAREMATRAILRLRQIAPVHVPMVPGNHDAESVWHLGDSLWCLFHKDKHVTIDNGESKRKYVEHGQVLLLFTHGNEEKRPDLPLLMAVEERQAWGRAKWCEVHVGHWHQVGLIEKMGVRVRLLSSLCRPDAWHANSGYVGNIRQAEAFMWHKDEGLVLTATYADWGKAA